MEDIDMEILQKQGHRHSRLIVWLGGMGLGDLSQSTKIKIQRLLLYTLLRDFFSFYSQHASFDVELRIKRRSSRFDATVLKVGRSPKSNSD